MEIEVWRAGSLGAEADQGARGDHGRAGPALRCAPEPDYAMEDVDGEAYVESAIGYAELAADVIHLGARLMLLDSAYDLFFGVPLLLHAEISFVLG